MTAMADEQGTGGRTRRQRQALARRAQILAVALPLFLQQGFAATTTRQIAAAAGVAESLIFHYFPTKASLISALAQRPGYFPGDLQTLLAPDRAGPVAEVVPALIDRLMRPAPGELHSFALMVAEAQTSPEVGHLLRHTLAELTDQVAAYLNRRVQAGDFRPGFPSTAVATLLYGGVMTFYLTHRFASDDAWQRAARRFGDELLAFFGAWSAPTTAPPAESDTVVAR